MLISSTDPEAGTTLDAGAPYTDVKELGHAPVWLDHTLDLVVNLCRALEEKDIAYCHWKSNNAIGKSASGENDLDLLVRRSDVSRFIEILHRLDFKQAKASLEKELPGVLNYFGYDRKADRIVHVHAHFALVLGHDLTKNVRLPIEKAYIDAGKPGHLFRVPAPEYEYVVFIIRMALKHMSISSVLDGSGKLNKKERAEFDYLCSLAGRNKVEDVLRRELPYLDPELFRRIEQIVAEGGSGWEKVRIGRALLRALDANARRPGLAALTVRLARQSVIFLRNRLSPSRSKYTLSCGGLMVVLVGGDGAGKTTVIESLDAWLSQYFRTEKVHMGRPPWSVGTIVVRAFLKLGQLMGLYPLETSTEETLKQTSPVPPAYPWMIREVCRARDRYRTYVHARRSASRGAIVLIDRYPLPEIEVMDGILIERFLHQLASTPDPGAKIRSEQGKRLAGFLVNREQRYYDRISRPEITIVLKVDPDLAVHRKGEEEASFVRERNAAIWETSWDGKGVYIVDAGRSRDEVMQQVKDIFWSEA